MSKREKLKAKIKNAPQDVRWAELVKFMKAEGFSLRKGKGTTRIFSRLNGLIITVHEPQGPKRVSEKAIDHIRDLLEL